MVERVHPRNSQPISEKTPSPAAAAAAAAANSSPRSGAYIIHVPNHQLHRFRASENVRRYAHYPRRNTSRCRCQYCCCLCRLIATVLVLAVLLAVAAGVLYLIFNPKVPDYAIELVAVKEMNLTSPASAAALSPVFDVTVSADNCNNDKIGIYYERGSSIKMFYKNTMLCDGVMPAFYQPSNNVTVFETVLTGNDVKLTAWEQRALVKAVKKRSVPLTLKVRAPVKIKVGSVKSWKIIVKVDCDVTVDELTAETRIVNKDCRHWVNW